MERVAQGDYAQSVFFMGEFSSAFNKMSREMHNRAEELSRLLERRFGPLDPAVTERLQKASATELERWADNILDASTLDEVFSSR